VEVFIVDVSGLREDPKTSVAVAGAASVTIAVLFWVWERDLLWMLAVLLPPIWSPVIYRYVGADSLAGPTRRGAALLAAGLAVAAVLAIVVFAASR
jgi:hypothetical protein